MYIPCQSVRRYVSSAIKDESHPVGWLWFTLASGDNHLPNGLRLLPDNDQGKGEEQVRQDNHRSAEVYHQNPSTANIVENYMSISQFVKSANAAP